MATKFQITVDCADPDRLTRFWADALGYVVPPPPDGFGSWDAYWRSRGVPDDELGQGDDSLVDPDGHGPRMWFQQVPEGKVVKNRLHLDLDVGGGRSAPLEARRERVLGEAERLTAAGASELRVLDGEAIDHFAVVMADPEGNEFCLH